ncbi:Tegument antigen [Schistosoma japonicum]|uniref:Tegument antigen n=2 Tax=Schistosoma japonicum TaxID=6182 RepID=C1LKF9_SCHJA|nr:Tegument antigen [Schistosoma japonicum]TNN07567.1 Tegument antigen [Schistosoma japonicum]TNN07568.1 Tegument antigen [Schistosoma japonicum]CAX75187.1 Tegument antigen (I(H)A) [Schistosoma japonicum]
MLEEFINAFLHVCADDDLVADRRELVDYCKKKQLDPNLVQQWLDLFDVDKDDQITIEEFCRALGLNQSEMCIEKVQRNKVNVAATPKVSKDIQIIISKMSPQVEYDITERVRELLSDVNNNKDADIKNISNELKQYLDNTYGRVWQVIVIRGSYWMNFSHEPFKSIQFKYGPYIFLLWRTPKG